MAAPTSSAFDLNKIIRPNIKQLKPYRCARDDYQDGVLLDANENLYGPPVAIDEKAGMPSLLCYPDPHQAKLKKLYGAWRSVDPDQIFVGVGSDEAIDMVMRMVCTPGKDSILICPPTYGMYKVSAAVNDVKVISVPLTEDFQIQPKKIQAAIEGSTKIIWICSPNNPTANDIEGGLVKEVLDSGFPGLVILDEAYVDFSERGSLATWTKRYPNLVVLQTFSKSWGLAGVRCGVAISSPPVVSYMNRMKAPYNLNALTSSVVIKNLEAKDKMLKTVAEIKLEKKRVRMALTSSVVIRNLEAKDKMLKTVAEIKLEKKRVRMGLEKIPHVVKIFPSAANFLLFRVKSNSKEIYRAIAKAGVVIRYRGDNHGCSECLRATVGRPKDNDTFLEKLKQVIADVVSK
eukprot:CAMPEP_0114537254 /NCGR_PEP_ID=MMETSP0109-20121206/29477_1 /TAXON_ID=29199 /ORGANISM="Chlorarachnion reptans, Strain CCCM449" /LENGTH=401 /DNA_ID=CAMNT_0001721125 /DNA_START=89 /DNA_END=1294 /DNA_ORIENTATION=-